MRQMFYVIVFVHPFLYECRVWVLTQLQLSMLIKCDEQFSGLQMLQIIDTSFEFFRTNENKNAFKIYA